MGRSRPSLRGFKINRYGSSPCGIVNAQGSRPLCQGGRRGAQIGVRKGSGPPNTTYSIQSIRWVRHRLTVVAQVRERMTSSSSSFDLDLNELTIAKDNSNADPFGLRWWEMNRDRRSSNRCDA